MSQVKAKQSGLSHLMVIGLGVGLGLVATAGMYATWDGEQGAPVAFRTQVADVVVLRFQRLGDPDVRQTARVTAKRGVNVSLRPGMYAVEIGTSKDRRMQWMQDSLWVPVDGTRVDIEKVPGQGWLLVNAAEPPPAMDAR